MFSTATPTTQRSCSSSAGSTISKPASPPRTEPSSISRNPSQLVSNFFLSARGYAMLGTPANSYLADNNDAQSWYLLGRCYMSQQKYPKAYEAYQQAVYRDGRNPTFWCSIGVLYYQINQYRDALDAYSRAIRLNPFISEVWYDLGTLVSFFSLSSPVVLGYSTVTQQLTTSFSTSPATTRSAMPWTPTSARPSWIPRILISRRDCSYCATATMVVRQLRHLCPPTSTLRLISSTAPSARLDLSGPVPAPRSNNRSRSNHNSSSSSSLSLAPLLEAIGAED